MVMRRFTSPFPEPARRALAAACAAALLVACADPPGNDPNVPDLAAFNANTLTACPHAQPSGCPRAPSYTSDIAPLVTRACQPCHGRGGVASHEDLSNYANLTRLETTVIAQVNGCLMPPADAGPDAMMAPAERTELVQWFVCKAPNN